MRVQFLWLCLIVTAVVALALAESRALALDTLQFCNQTGMTCGTLNAACETCDPECCVRCSMGASQELCQGQASLIHCHEDPMASCGIKEVGDCAGGFSCTHWKPTPSLCGGVAQCHEY